MNEDNEYQCMCFVKLPLSLPTKKPLFSGVGLLVIAPIAPITPCVSCQTSLLSKTLSEQSYKS